VKIYDFSNLRKFIQNISRIFDLAKVSPIKVVSAQQRKAFGHAHGR